MTQLIVTISGNFSPTITDQDLRDLEEDLDEMMRLDYGGASVLVTVSRA